MIENKLPDQLRRLGKALLISGALNIVLFTVIFYLLVKETPPTPYCELKLAEQKEQQAPLALEQSNVDIIRNFRNLSIEQLAAKLSNIQLVENGYTQRDIALAALVAFRHFDLSRALLGHAQPTQQRKISCGKNRANQSVEVIVYPGLSEEQFQAIIHFANTERWPLTSHGLFLQLRKQIAKKIPLDPSLTDSFFLTPEFLAIEMLFNRSEIRVEKTELLAVICQGTWTLLSSFTEQQRVSQDLSPAKRQRLLLDYIAQESRAAAYLLLKTDGPFAARKLDDEHVIAILNLLVEKTAEAEQFALMNLTSPRGDAVWQLAAARLYEFAGEPRPEKNLHHAALIRFVPQANVAAEVDVNKPTTPPKNQNPPPKPTRGRTYVVQEGDSLWKISRRFNIDMDALKAYNKLQSDFLKPGTTLKIP